MELSPELLSSFGMMNKVSTGNMFLDMVLCMALPLLLREIMPRLQTLLNQLREWFLLSKKQEEEEYTRTLKHKQRGGYWYWGSEDEPANNLLQRAVLLYIGSKTELHDKFKTAAVELVKTKDEQAVRGSDDDSDDEDGCNSNSQLESYRVNVIPPQDDWVEVEPGLKMMRHVSAENEDTGNSTNTTTHWVVFTLTAKGPGARQLVEGFLDRAFAYYKEQMTLRIDPSRYLYTPLSITGPKEGDKGACVLYKRYKLSDEKTFESLFHPEKAALLRLVDHFLNKTGKFAIRGYSHKLGILLWGPPGTGKTSLIKALAHYTGRNIVSIPLAKIETNQELMDVVFDQQYKVNDEELPIRLPFQKTIFVMEDVDAACRVVQRRAPAVTTTKTETVQRTVAGGEAAGGGGASQIETRSTSTTATVSDAIGAACAAVKAAEAEASTSRDGEGLPALGPLLPDGDKDSKKGLGMGGWLESPDKLNLAGLLNVLDGVVDCPRRMVVMTTNHPEKLDPALIRPGRVNKEIYMGHLALPEALGMVRHYFGAAAPPQEAPLAAAFCAAAAAKPVSPAELEMMCANFDTVEELVAALEARGRGGASHG